jgi:Transposase DDE domain
MQLAIVPPLRRPLRPEGTPDPLREQLAAHVEHSVLDMLDPAFIEALAEDMRLVKRKRVHHAGLMVCAFILSAFERSTDTEGRLLDARIVYEKLGGPPSGKTSFRKMAHKLLPVHHRLLRRRLRRLAAALPTEEMRGRLSHLADVLIPDGCAFKLARALSGLYPGTGTAAELKLHAVYSVKAHGCIQINPTAGSVHDSDGFWPSSWVSGALYLWDLGYQNYERFIDATEAGAYVLQRLKELSNPVVLASYGPTGCRRSLLGQDGRPLRLNEACEFGYVHHQAVLDLDVEIAAGSRKITARVVCVPHQGEDRYYLTTLSRDIFSAHDIAELYRVRWEVELLFRSWKGALRLDEVRRLSHPHSLDLAVTSSLLAALLGREIHDGLERFAREQAASVPTAAALPAAVFPPAA